MTGYRKGLPYGLPKKENFPKKGQIFSGNMQAHAVGKNYKIIHVKHWVGFGWENRLCGLSG